MKKQVTIRLPKWLALGIPLILVAIALMGADQSCSSQTSASTDNATNASNKWGASPTITNFYEYQQLKQIYEERDNPKLILNAYLFSDVTGQLTCLGKVKGFGIPYGTQWSQPQAGNNQGSIPEPNGLYPSTSTSADWVQLVNPDGSISISFIEPNMIITSQSLPCTPLKGTTNP